MRALVFVLCLVVVSPAAGQPAPGPDETLLEYLRARWPVPIRTGLFSPPHAPSDAEYCRAYAMLSTRTRERITAQQFVVYARTGYPYTLLTADLGAPTIEGTWATVKARVRTQSVFSRSVAVADYFYRLPREEERWRVWFDDPQVAIVLRATDAFGAQYPSHRVTPSVCG